MTINHDETTRNSSISNMNRFLRTCVTLNLAVAFLVFFCYLTLRFDQFDATHFRLLYSDIGQELGPAVAGLFEVGMVILFYANRFSSLSQKKTRIAFAFVGAWGLWISLVSPVIIAQVYGDPWVTLDNALGWYVWSSHLMFGAVGSNKSGARGSNHLDQHKICGRETPEVVNPPARAENFAPP